MLDREHCISCRYWQTTNNAVGVCHRFPPTGGQTNYNAEGEPRWPMKPMQMVWQMEKSGLMKRGSYAWFKANGGITSEHVTEARVDRAACQP